MAKAIWILVNCNSKKEAEKIGYHILKLRLASCFDIVPRFLAAYYWPPQSGKIERQRGATLILETFPDKYSQITRKVKKMHSDRLPFIGFIQIEGIDRNYLQWMKNELK